MEPDPLVAPEPLEPELPAPELLDPEPVDPEPPDPLEPEPVEPDPAVAPPPEATVVLLPGADIVALPQPLIPRHPSTRQGSIPYAFIQNKASPQTLCPMF